MKWTGLYSKVVGSFLAVDKASRGTRNYQPDGTERSRKGSYFDG